MTQKYNISKKCIIIILIILILILILIRCNKGRNENFTTLPTLESPAFFHLYDNHGNKLNISLISKPFGYDSDYKLFLNNINKYIYLGITSYMEFPYLPSNPVDNYVLEEKTK